MRLPTHLSERHQLALKWFFDRAGEEVAWPQPLEDDILLATKAKGIYKPSWSKYAISIRQSLVGPYPDKSPIFRTDGTWSYLYFQENDDPDLRDNEYTNIGLMNCIQDQVPVGVFIQTKGKPGPRYRIMGIAIPTRWTNGYFLFEGVSPLPLYVREKVTPYLTATSDDLNQLLTETETALNLANGFDPTNLADSRERVVAGIIRRRGQPAFRQALIQAYSGRCAITQFDAIDALEAGHILPYRGIQTSVVSNGLLLRADVHTLFDLGQIAVDPNTMTVVLKNHLQETRYSTLNGISLYLPDNRALHPDMQALAMHRAWAGI